MFERIRSSWFLFPLGFFALSNLYVVVRSPVLGDDLYSPFAVWIQSKGEFGELMRLIPFGLENGHVSLLGRTLSYIWNFIWIWCGTQLFPGNHIFYYQISRLLSFALGASALILLFKIVSNGVNSSLRTKIYLTLIFCGTLTYYGSNSNDPTSSYPIISYPTVLLGLVPLWIYINNHKALTRVICLKIFLFSILAIGYYELNFSLVLTFVFFIFWNRNKMLASTLLIAIYAILFMYSSNYAGTDLNFSFKVFFATINSFFSSVPLIAQILITANSRSELVGLYFLSAIFLSSIFLCFLVYRKFKGDFPKALENLGVRYEGIQLVVIFLVNVLIIQSSTSKSQIELVQIGRVYTANPYLHLFWLALVGLGTAAIRNCHSVLLLKKKLVFTLSTLVLAPILAFNVVAVDKTSNHFAMNVDVLQNWDEQSPEFCNSLESWNLEEWPDYYRKEFTKNISKSAVIFLERTCRIEN